MVCGTFAGTLNMLIGAVQAKQGVLMASNQVLMQLIICGMSDVSYLHAPARKMLAKFCHMTHDPTPFHPSNCARDHQDDPKLSKMLAGQPAYMNPSPFPGARNHGNLDV